MSTPYDSVLYPNYCLPQSHPDRLGVIGKLFGVQCAQPESCRVLELGCGDGANLLPLAMAFPESRFVGIDLSSKAIEAGQEAVAQLQLSNLKLVHGDLTTFGKASEPFDYIIAHGVYSWVPQSVRRALLALTRNNLSQQGVAFISYNCLPGCHIRRMVREIMRFHVRDVEEPDARVQQALAISRFIAGSIEKPDSYRQIFKDQLEQIQRHGLGHLFHDDLADINDPCYFHEFIAESAQHGLQFLAEADYFEMQDELFTPEVRQVLGQMKEDRITREQYLDFLKCRRFRQTLLCHCETELRTEPSPEAISSFHVSSNALEATTSGTGVHGPILRFSEPKGGALELDHPAACAALRILKRAWPASIPFSEILDQVAHLHPPTTGVVRLEALLSEVLLNAYSVGMVYFHLSPVRCATGPTQRPQISKLNQWQIVQGKALTTRRGETLRIDDDEARRFIGWLDGSHTLEDLSSLASAHLSHPVGTEATVSDRLQELARMALLDPES